MAPANSKDYNDTSTSTSSPDVPSDAPFWWLWFRFWTTNLPSWCLLFRFRTTNPLRANASYFFFTRTANAINLSNSTLLKNKMILSIIAIPRKFLGMNNMMVQLQNNLVKPEGGLSNNLPNGPRKRSRDSMEDQFNNFNIPPVTNNVPIQGFAPQSNFPYDVQHLRDIGDVLSQFNKNIKHEYETQQE